VNGIVRSNPSTTSSGNSPRPADFPTDDAVVKLLWLAIVNIEDKRARQRAARTRQDGARTGHPGRLIEGTKTYGWAEALNKLAAAYPGRIQ